MLDRIAQKHYDEKRRELERLLYGTSHKYLPRFRTRDAAGAAFTYRMGAGFPGDVNRTHPASIEPCLIDATSSSTYPTYYGQPVVGDTTTQGVRTLASGDSALTDIYGVTVRPFPLQSQTTTGTLTSAGAPPTSGIIDILRTGYIMVQLGNGALTGATKFGTVYVYLGTTTGNHILSMFEASSSGSPATLLTSVATFNGVQDSSGIVELALHQG